MILAPLTEAELDAVLQAAHEAMDHVMLDIVRKAQAGDAFYAGLVLGYVRNVPLYQEAIEEMRGPCGRLVSFADGELTGEDESAFRDHLKGCKACQTELGDTVALRERIAVLGLGVTP